MTFTVHIPQLIFVALVVLSLVIVATMHGKPKTGKHNIFVDLLSAGISFALLYWGGFFK
jgi:hypothetical protein